MRSAVVLGAWALASGIAHADEPEAPPVAPAPAPGARATPRAPPPQPVVGFRIRGKTKIKPETLGYLSHVELGDPIGERDVSWIRQALLSSELFKTVEVTLEDAPGEPSPGVIIVVTAVDKQSWIVAPTAIYLPGNKAFGLGYAESNFRGLDQKYLVYGQLGTRTSLFFGTFLVPSVHGSKLTWRADLYAYRRDIKEYENPPGDETSEEIARTTQATYLGGGALIGWNFRWWLVGDLRLRGAYVRFRDSEDANEQRVPVPQEDGRDVTLQAHLTLDHRHHRYGVTWGSYVQLTLESSIPWLDSYGYQTALLRAYQSWRLFEAHELELRAIGNVGRHLPLHEDLTLGGVGDLRGYEVDQFRGDVRGVVRAEYSVPLFKWRALSFRALGFYDGGYIQLRTPRDDRNYLANQLAEDYFRNDVGAGLRIYVRSIVLPLVGLDVGYGLEGQSPQLYFQLGMTEF